MMLIRRKPRQRTKERVAELALLLIEAARETTRRKRATIVVTVTGFLLAGCLYSIGYQTGSYPVLGFCLAMAAGALLVPFGVAVGMKTEGARIYWPASAILVYGLVIGGILAPAMYVVFNASLSLSNKAYAEVSTWILNDQALITKPLWHMAMGSAVGIAVAPVMLVAWPVMIRSGVKAGDAMMLGWRRFEGKKYDRTAVTLVFGTVALLGSTVPLLQLFIPAAMAQACLVAYRRWNSSAIPVGK